MNELSVALKTTTTNKTLCLSTVVVTEPIGFW